MNATDILGQLLGGGNQGGGTLNSGAGAKVLEDLLGVGGGNSSGTRQQGGEAVPEVPSVNRTLVRLLAAAEVVWEICLVKRSKNLAVARQAVTTRLSKRHSHRKFLRTCRQRYTSGQ